MAELNWGLPKEPVDPKTIVGSPEWDAERTRLLAVWDADKAALASIKEREMASRVAAAEWVIPSSERKSGVNNVELHNGFVAKVTHKINHNIVVSNKTVEEAEDIAATIGNEATFLFERIITWKPEFSVSEYKKLDMEFDAHRKVKELVDTLIETKAGAPTLEIKPPKA